MGNRECFSFVYPVTYTMPDGSTMEVTGDDEDGWSALKAWYEDNTGYESNARVKLSCRYCI